MKTWWPLLLLTLPFLASLALKPALSDIFHDRRKTDLAKPIESFEAGAAGGRVTLALETKRYEVQRGDSWSSIARKHRVKDVEALRLHNQMIGDLRPGMSIEIPEHLVEVP